MTTLKLKIETKDQLDQLIKIFGLNTVLESTNSYCELFNDYTDEIQKIYNKSKDFIIMLGKSSILFDDNIIEQKWNQLFKPQKKDLAEDIAQYYVNVNRKPFKSFYDYIVWWGSISAS